MNQFGLKGDGLKTSGCDPHMQINKKTTCKWILFDHMLVEIDKYHDASEVNGASSNTPRRVCYRQAET